MIKEASDQSTSINTSSHNIELNVDEHDAFDTLYCSGVYVYMIKMYN